MQKKLNSWLFTLIFRDFADLLNMCSLLHEDSSWVSCWESKFYLLSEDRLSVLQKISKRKSFKISVSSVGMESFTY